MLQELSDDMSQQFVVTVAQQRKLPITKIDQWANGNLFTGNQALKIGLIDAVGSQHTAATKIKELALIGREIEWITQEPTSLITRFLHPKINRSE